MLAPLTLLFTSRPTDMEFDELIKPLLKHEGGYVNHTSGISEHELSALLESALHKAADKAAMIYSPPANSRDYECSVDGCSRPAYAKGMCNAHYIRNRSGKKLSTPVRASKRDGLCCVCGAESGAKGGWGMCHKHYGKTRRDVLKEAAVAAFGSSCKKCGGAFHRAVFDFHHIGEKEASPSSLFANASAKAIAKELVKCVLLCANCHRMEHAHEL